MSEPAGRPGTLSDAVAGVVPRQVVTPSSVEEAAGLIGDLTRDGRAVAFVGGGTDLGLGAPPRSLDTVVRTERLCRILEHSPSDQIVVVEAGLPLAALSRSLAAHGQRLALDPPLPERATAGGVLAANAFGPLRTRYGGPRDLVIGVTMVRADGSVAKGGGKVVKNVAGFDLPRMLVGSIGTLGLIATVAYRLHPLPEVTETLHLGGVGSAQVLALLRTLRERQLEPSAVTALSSGEGWELAIVFEGFASGVAQQRDRLLSLSREVGRPVDVAPPLFAAAFRERHDVLRSAPPVRLKVSAPPASFGAGTREVLSKLSAALPSAGSVWYPTLGIAFVGGEAAELAPLAAAIGEARHALAPAGGSTVVSSAPAGLLAGLDPWGETKALGLMRALKERLDPGRCLAPGRFVGGL
jgi:glycolate oxidase FAD binding subunit